ncbi:MAG: SMC-Scp complex subunit ScpB [Neisseriaceae bacterium]|nr:SMC-Scp complex subunit ScpB [Neisseriaceae bacterium]
MEKELPPDCVIEAALLTSAVPLSRYDLRRLFEPKLPQEALSDALVILKARWRNRALQLSETADGWQFSVAGEIVSRIPHLYAEKHPKYSRAVMETLAIIAYRQPVTRGDIEAVRGVAVSSQIMQVLQERGWIEIVGQKEVAGKPNLWATTEQFLHDLRLKSLKELPPLEEIGQLIEENQEENSGSLKE